ncbi:MAG: prepilin peptidase [Micromonosporaceae bacterium]|nr:prepilin peptidase [Micromonosporaceae bacterium]
MDGGVVIGGWGAVAAGSVAAAAVCGVIGALSGPLLARPAYRLSVDTGEPARGTCGDCDAALGWFSVAPCPSCGRRLGPPAWALAVVAAVACAGIGWRFGFSAALVPYVLLALLGVLLGAIDLACLRLPDVLVKPGFVVGLVLLAALSFGSWESLLRSLAAAALLAVGYLVLALLPGANLGYGDVKLAGLLGLFLGWLGWREVLIGAVLPFLLNGVVAVVLLALRRVNRRTLVPFGPAMLVGAWLAIVAQLPLS